MRSYVPSFALCIIALILFALSVPLHLLQLIRYRTWYFTPLSLALFLEIVGYIARTLSAKRDPYNVLFFVLQYFFIVTAPVFISASIYVCLSRLIEWSRIVDPQLKGKIQWLKPRGVLWGFIVCDVVATITQIAGAALIGSAESNRRDPTTANNILLAGLAVQTFTFLVFIVLLTVFTVSLSRSEVFGPRLGGKRPFFLALFAASGWVWLRTIFRLAETSEGVLGYLSTHEVYFGVFEFMPMVLAVWILGVWHPGRWVGKRERSVEEGRGEKKGLFRRRQRAL